MWPAVSSRSVSAFLLSVCINQGVSGKPSTLLWQACLIAAQHRSAAETICVGHGTKGSGDERRQ